MYSPYLSIYVYIHIYVYIYTFLHIRIHSYIHTVYMYTQLEPRSLALDQLFQYLSSNTFDETE